MMLRIGSTLAAMVLFAVMGTALALWGVNILPSVPLRGGFIVLVVITCLIGLRTVARDPRISHSTHTRARPAQVPEQTLVTVPASSPAGMCWQCGFTVRGESLVCWKCGATQPQRHDLLPSMMPGKETDWDRNETVYHVPEPDVLPAGSLPIYRVDVPEGWSRAEAGAFIFPVSGNAQLRLPGQTDPFQSPVLENILGAPPMQPDVESQHSNLASTADGAGPEEGPATPSEAR